MRRLSFYLFAIALCASTVFADTSTQKKFKFGMIVPLTGNYAPGGVDNRQGAEAAVALAGFANPFEFVYADSKAEPATGLSEFRRLISSDGVLGVFVMRGSVGSVLNPVSRSAGVPLLGAVGNKDFTHGNEFAFQAWSKSDEEGEFLAEIFHGRKFAKVAIVTVEDDWQSSVSEGLRTKYPRKGSRIVLDQAVMPGESDFRTLIVQAKSADAEVVFGNLSLAQTGMFLKQARQLRLSVPIYGNFWVGKRDLVESVGTKVVEGVRFVEMDTNLPSLQSYVSKTYSATPSGATLAGYAATMLLLQTIHANNQIKSRAELQAALLKQTEVRTPDGALPIKDRCIKFPLVENVMIDGKAESVDASSQHKS